MKQTVMVTSIVSDAQEKENKKLILVYFKSYVASNVQHGTYKQHENALIFT